MKQLRTGLTLVSVMALMALAGAPSASATTLETKGAAENAAITLKASLASSTSTLMTDTSGFFLSTCSISNLEGSTASPFTSTRVGGPLSTLTFGSCTEDAKEKTVVDAPGSLSVEAISGTTNGTVFWSNAKWTMPSPFGKLTCLTASGGTDIGKLTGVASGKATIDLSAVINCSVLTGKWSGSYTITSPEGLGVTA
jgi:hypothetical protein